MAIKQLTDEQIRTMTVQEKHCWRLENIWRGDVAQRVQPPAAALVAAEENLPLPTFLIIDSPTKNISDDENPDLVKALYREIYALATRKGRKLQFILIDSDLVCPDPAIPEFISRRIAGEPDAPRLIPYYDGP